MSKLRLVEREKKLQKNPTNYKMAPIHLELICMVSYTLHVQVFVYSLKVRKNVAESMPGTQYPHLNKQLNQVC